MRTASVFAMPPPKQKPVTPSLPVLSGRVLQPHGRGVQVLAPSSARSTLPNSCAALVVVAGIAADRGEAVGRERHEVLEREPARDVFDVRVEPAVLVDDQDARAACCVPALAGRTR